MLILIVGGFVEQRDSTGTLLPVQCSGSTGLCYCAYAKDRSHFRKYFRMTNAPPCPLN